jgi:hypothetical protein
MSHIIKVKGRNIDQRELRKFLDEVDWESLRGEDENGDEIWQSPITGENFRTKFMMYGHLGAYLRKPSRKDLTEPTRRGYMRALRAGVEPSDAQRAAHRDYVAAQRAGKKLADANDGVRERIADIKQAKGKKAKTAEFNDRKAERIAVRRARAEAAFAAEEASVG